MRQSRGRGVQRIIDQTRALNRDLIDAFDESLTNRFRVSLKHKNVGQTKFIKLNTQR